MDMPQTQLERLLIEQLQQVSTQSSEQVLRLTEQLQQCAQAQQQQALQLQRLSAQVLSLSSLLKK